MEQKIAGNKLKMRIAEFQEFLRKEKIDFALFASNSLNKKDKNITYFTGTDIEECFLCIPKSGRVLFFISRLEEEKTRKKLGVKDEAGKKNGIKLMVPEKTVFDEMKNLFKSPSRIGVNNEIFSLKENDELKKRFDAEIVDVSGFCRKLREIKTVEEINLIRKSCRISDKIMADCVDNFRKFNTETDVKNFIKNGVHSLNVKEAFEPIVASGKNASVPHYESQNVKLRKGFCIIDLGVKYREYCSDLTRTFYIGNPSIREIKMYNTLLKAQEYAIASAGAGAIASDVDKKTRNSLGDFNRYFIHSLGHQLGVEIHENNSFRLSINCDRKLKKNMVFAIEPGIYEESKWGLRIEDTVLVSEKVLCLTKYPKKFKYV